MVSLRIAGGALLVAMFGIGAAQADGFICPVAQVPAAQSEAVTQLLPDLQSFRDQAKLDAAIDKLKNDGDGVVQVVNSMIATYCPLVASEQGKTDAQKTRDVQNFGLTVTRQAFSLASEEEIILDIALTPDVVEVINNKAKAANTSPQEWVADKISEDIAE